jgi:hypothetical protein
MISTSLEVWVAAFLTLCVFSYLWKNNIAYNFAENTLLGVTLAYFFVNAVKAIYDLGVRPILQGDLSFLLSIVLGLMLLTQLSSEYRWMSRWPLALLISVALASQARTTITTNILKQISETALSLTSGLNNIVLAACVILGVSYFYFSAEGEKGIYPQIHQLGRYVLYIAFGAMYGSTVTSRLALFIGRIMFLLKTWLGF